MVLQCVKYYWLIKNAEMHVKTERNSRKIG